MTRFESKKKTRKSLSNFVKNKTPRQKSPDKQSVQFFYGCSKFVIEKLILMWLGKINSMVFQDFYDRKFARKLLDFFVEKPLLTSDGIGIASTIFNPFRQLCCSDSKLCRIKSMLFKIPTRVSRSRCSLCIQKLSLTYSLQQWCSKNC